MIVASKNLGASFGRRLCGQGAQAARLLMPAVRRRPGTGAAVETRSGEPRMASPCPRVLASRQNQQVSGICSPESEVTA